MTVSATLGDWCGKLYEETKLKAIGVSYNKNQCGQTRSYTQACIHINTPTNHAHTNLPDAKTLNTEYPHNMRDAFNLFRIYLRHKYTYCWRNHIRNRSYTSPALWRYSFSSILVYIHDQCSDRRGEGSLRRSAGVVRVFGPLGTAHPGIFCPLRRTCSKVMAALPEEIG